MATLPSLNEIWDYQNPAETEKKFMQILADSDKFPEEYILILQTQIARTYSLQRKFNEAHELLDIIHNELKDKGLGLVETNYFLERGRTFNSNNEHEKAYPLFENAFEKAKEIENDFLAIDAAHMIAIVDKKKIFEME